MPVWTHGPTDRGSGGGLPRGTNLLSPLLITITAADHTKDMALDARFSTMQSKRNPSPFPHNPLLWHPRSGTIVGAETTAHCLLTMHRPGNPFAGPISVCLSVSSCP